MLNRGARPVTLDQVLISIVIPAFNEAKYLPASLEAAHRSRTVLGQAGWASEVIVCDNNSTDDTAAVAEANGARVVFEPFNQIAASRNAAGRAAKGDWLVFVDADTQVSPRLFREMMRAMARDDCLGGGCPVVFDSGPWLVRQTVILWNIAGRIMRWAAGSFLFCRASAFHELGGFSSDFFAAEEVEYCIRLNRLGHRLAKRMIILNEPVITSGRKVRELFSWQNLAHGLEAIVTFGDALKNRDNCKYWYDPVR
ncbi:MAG: glycosyltransferase involved in cell wall biosynthesis [Limisphaerales bacterium]|jgi:glycosyltransferase involved in cell wall biosynthesis